MAKSYRAARGVSNGNRTPAGLDADAADMLADDMAASEFVQFPIAGVMIKSIRSLVDGRGRTRRQTTDAAPAGKGQQRPGRAKGSIGEHRHQPDSRAEPGCDKKIVAAYPAQAGKMRNGLVRDVGPLVLPIDDLGGRDGKRIESEILEERREEECAAVKEEIRLPIMMEVEGRRLVLDVLENAVVSRFPRARARGNFSRSPAGRRSSPRIGVISATPKSEKPNSKA